MKRVSKMLTVSLCMLVVLFLSATLKTEAANVHSGDLGDNGGVHWTYEEDTKTLIITGEDTGEFGDDSQGSVFNSICSDVETIIVKDCKVYDCSYMFSKLRYLNKVIFEGFNTSQVTDMQGMFTGCWRLASVNVECLDTSNVEEMSSMFVECSGLTELNVSGFDTSNVNSMAGMFVGCNNLTRLDVDGFDTSNVENMNAMFYLCENLTELDVSGFDTSNTMYMSDMFCGCSELKQLDVSGFDTSNVTVMDRMFAGCCKLSQLDVSGFDTSNVTVMKYMFSGCSGLDYLDLSAFDLENVTSVADMLKGCGRLEWVRTPKKMSESLSIDLPDVFEDEQGNKTTTITKTFCSKTLQRYGVDQVKSFVERMYTIVLGRSAEPQGLDDWTKRLMAKEIDGATLVDMFVNSDEFITRNTSDEEYIKILYRAVLGREADVEGLKTWKDTLADDWTRDYVLEGLVFSTEFKRICDSYGIIAVFEPTAESQVRRFVKRMYTVVLNRRADEEGLTRWTLRLIYGTANGAQIADGFISSDEFVNRNLSNEKYVKVLYRAFFNREADEGGFNVWMNELAKGASRRDVMKGFVHSVEFSDLCAQYGIIRGEIQ